jgi:hypothetical protein
MNTFIDLIPFILIYATLCWIILPGLTNKATRWLIALVLIYPSFYLGDKSEIILTKILAFFKNLF